VRLHLSLQNYENGYGCPPLFTETSVTEADTGIRKKKKLGRSEDRTTRRDGERDSYRPSIGQEATYPVPQNRASRGGGNLHRLGEDGEATGLPTKGSKSRASPIPNHDG